MDTLLKYALYATGLGLVIYFAHKASQKASEWVNKITFKIVDFQLPTYAAGKFTVPLLVRITNASPLMAPIQNVLIKLSALRNSNFIEFGQVNSGPFTLYPGTFNQSFLPVLDVGKLNPFSPNGNLLTNITQVLSNTNPLVDIKIDTTVIIEGVALPTQTERKQLYLKQLLAA